MLIWTFPIRVYVNSTIIGALCGSKENQETRHIGSQGTTILFHSHRAFPAKAAGNQEVSEAKRSQDPRGI